MAKQLSELITDDGVRSTFFFNGRLLAAGDLQREQEAGRIYRQKLGAAIGSGVVSGLGVSIAGSSGTLGVDQPDTLAITAGTALTAAGQMLVLAQDTSIVVATGIEPGTTSGGDFMYCQRSTPTPVATSTGIHVLLMSAAADYAEYAPLSGLGAGGKISGCGRKYLVDGVQFRLVQLKLPTESEIGGAGITLPSLAALKDRTNLDAGTVLPASDMADLSMLRNRVAYLCFGPPSGDLFARLDRPFPSQYDGVTKLLSDPRKIDTDVDVPLALIYWTARGLRFVDMGSVRRSPAPPFDGNPLAAFLSGRRARAGEAMVLQFAEHLAWLRETGGQLNTRRASEHFRYLPPMGLLPLGPGNRSAAGLSPVTFFNGLKVRNPDMGKASQESDAPLYIEGAELEAMMREALAYPAMDLSSVDSAGERELIWLYWVRENRMAIDLKGANASTGYLLFTNGHVPYRGDARYDLNYWDFGNWA